MKKLLIISYSNLARDPRVSRQIRYLSRHFDVTAAGYGPASLQTHMLSLDVPPNSVAHRLIRALSLRLGRYEKVYWNTPVVRQSQATLTGLDFNLVLANDVDTLPVALHLANGTPVLLDAHEYAPREFEESLLWRMTMQPYKEYLCSNYLPRAAGMITVCQGIADEYDRVYAVKPRVVLNAPEEQDLLPQPVSSGRIRLIHHDQAGSLPG